jgi:hypothetical protein
MRSSTDADASTSTDRRAREGGDLLPPLLPLLALALLVIVGIHPAM